ncbi:ImmA/IrrE family metallo-endopeptidase [Streptomyces sp. MBT27]|uniref:ImmA/IrrE family metallo-endopeptidase n=1 Tax=Streptomyces sp. MBT27 TaxID=1488356 RepID=UPI00141DB15C|nr:ImmA/IrrE family metallo-endopeptidase [Streptomyces sp. MBT27]
MAIPTASRQRITDALRGFDIPFPLTVDSLHQAMQEQRDRPLILHREAFPSKLEQPCGLWWPDDEGRDHVWINPQAIGLQGVQSLAHELGHMLLGHPPLKELPAGLLNPAEPAAWEIEDLAAEFTLLSPAFLDGSFLGVRARSRDVRRDPEYVLHEEEAENFGSLLRRRAMVQGRDRHDDPLLDRLHRSL